MIAGICYCGNRGAIRSVFNQLRTVTVDRAIRARGVGQGKYFRTIQVDGYPEIVDRHCTITCRSRVRCENGQHMTDICHAKATAAKS